MKKTIDIGHGICEDAYGRTCPFNVGAWCDVQDGYRVKLRRADYLPQRDSHCPFGKNPITITISDEVAG